MDDSAKKMNTKINNLIKSFAAQRGILIRRFMPEVQGEDQSVQKFLRHNQDVNYESLDVIRKRRIGDKRGFIPLVRNAKKRSNVNVFVAVAPKFEDGVLSSIQMEYLGIIIFQKFLDTDYVFAPAPRNGSRIGEIIGQDHVPKLKKKYNARDNLEISCLESRGGIPGIKRMLLAFAMSKINTTRFTNVVFTLLNKPRNNENNLALSAVIKLFGFKRKGHKFRKRTKNKVST